LYLPVLLVGLSVFHPQRGQGSRLIFGHPVQMVVVAVVVAVMGFT
jgi:hypothetical protein